MSGAERTERVELTVLCLLRRDGEILLQRRAKADWPGYVLPGGHVEPGESIVEAVVREMREETGLTVLHPRLCGVKQFPIRGGRYLVLLFCAEAFTGELCSSEEGEVVWVPRNELSRYDTAADFEVLLRVMEDPALTEFQYVVRGEDWQVLLR